MTPLLLLEQMLNGLQLGVTLFLIAAGLTLVLGIMNLVNLAHGSLYMLGAYLAATLANVPLIVVSIGIIMGAFGQVTVNDALVGKYTPEEWRSRAYAVRYFVGFTAAGASVGLVAWLYERGGFATMLQAFAGLCLFVIAAAIILPREVTPKPAV